MARSRQVDHDRGRRRGREASEEFTLNSRPRVPSTSKLQRFHRDDSLVIRSLGRCTGTFRWDTLFIPMFCIRSPSTYDLSKTENLLPEVFTSAG